MRVPFQVADCGLLIVSSYGREKVRELSGVSLVRTLIPFMRAPLHDLINQPKALSPNAITLGIRISTYEWGWGGI